VYVYVETVKVSDPTNDPTESVKVLLTTAAEPVYVEDFAPALIVSAFVETTTFAAAELDAK
jgi:hypothetical protein